MANNSRAAGLFEVEVRQTGSGATVDWSKDESWRAWAKLNEGCYLLRTNVTDWSAEELWQAYIQLTEAEAAFRIHKSDLRVRPVWHQKEDRVQAHILVCFIAYVLWKTLHQMPGSAGLGDEPRRLFDELGTISLVDVILPTRGVWTYAAAAFANPQNIRLSCYPVWGFQSPSRSKTQAKCSEDFQPGRYQKT